uniref:Uncharacterized protein n=1 Tax=Grammatophora oceanica TaxID=210454 RepID=A0A6U5J3R5_9STRA|mmetsp:Transcript_24010/g.35440  ORF Transcript_24010/g.35440 Transcript_24010/m.35440 type:complete len:117 (+) Transcript_24010:999-1349(+)
MWKSPKLVSLRDSQALQPIEHGADPIFLLNQPALSLSFVVEQASMHRQVSQLFYQKMQPWVVASTQSHRKMEPIAIGGRRFHLFGVRRLAGIEEPLASNANARVASSKTFFVWQGL